MTRVLRSTLAIALPLIPANLWLRLVPALSANRPVYVWPLAAVIVINVIGEITMAVVGYLAGWIAGRREIAHAFVVWLILFLYPVWLFVHFIRMGPVGPMFLLGPASWIVPILVGGLVCRFVRRRAAAFGSTRG